MNQFHPGPSNILSQTTALQLEAEATRTDFPKWGTLCLLKSLHLPVLDAAFIAPGYADAHALCVIHEFAAFLAQDELMVRSDGGQEHGAYYRGGHTLSIGKATQLALELSRAGRAVILMEPCNRFAAKLNVNLLILQGGMLVIELLGPGYDTSDLNRGDISPQVTIVHQADHWLPYERPWRSDFNYSMHFEEEAERKQRRLTKICERLLPALGVSLEGKPEDVARRWLLSHGFTQLWQEWNPCIMLSQLRHWYDDAFTVSQHIGAQRNWTALVLSGADLGDRFVWWDVADAKQKFVSPQINHLLSDR